MTSESTLDARIAERERVVKEQAEAKERALLLEVQLASGFRPSRDRLVVRKALHDETAGGIVLPENQKRRPVTGTVVATGPLAREYAVGDVVMFMDYAGVEIESPQGNRLEKHIVCTESEIFGKWEPRGS